MQPFASIIGGPKKEGAFATILDRYIERLRTFHNYRRHLLCPISKRISP